MIKSRYSIIIIIITQILFCCVLTYVLLKGYSNYKLAQVGSTSVHGFIANHVGVKWFIWPITLLLSVSGLKIRRVIGWILTSHLYFVIGISSAYLGFSEMLTGSIIEQIQIFLLILVVASLIIILNLKQVLNYFRIPTKSRIWINIFGIVIAQVLVLLYSRIDLWHYL